MLDAMAQDVRFENQREPTEAILAWKTNRPDHLETMLIAIEDHPNHMALQIAIALASFKQERWQLAYDNALAVVSRRPSLAIMHSIRGRALGKMGRWAEATDPLNRSIKGEAVQSNLLLWAAEAWMESGDMDTAQTLVAQAQKLAPWDPRIRRAQFALTSRGQ